MNDYDLLETAPPEAWLFNPGIMDALMWFSGTIAAITILYWLTMLAGMFWSEARAAVKTRNAGASAFGSRALRAALGLLLLALAAAVAQAHTAREVSASIYPERANRWVAKGEWERAVADFDLAIASASNLAAAWFNRAALIAVSATDPRSTERCLSEK